MMPKGYFKAINIRKPKFIKGALVLILVLITAVNSRPAVEMVFNTYAQNSGQKKKLPIYSVDVSEKKIALSFDAAWGDG